MLCILNWLVVHKVKYSSINIWYFCRCINFDIHLYTGHSFQQQKHIWVSYLPVQSTNRIFSWNALHMFKSKISYSVFQLPTLLNKQASFVDPKTIGTLVSVGLVLVVLLDLVVGFFKCLKARHRRQSHQAPSASGLLITKTERYFFWSTRLNSALIYYPYRHSTSFQKSHCKNLFYASVLSYI